MAGVKVFTDLLMWQRARQWSKVIFEQTEGERFARDERLVRQVNDSSESVMANIAEGFGRGTLGEFITFLGYAIGSLSETQSHLCAAYDRRYLERDTFGKLFQDGTEIRKMIVSFVRSMVMPGSGVKNIRKQKSWSDEVWEIYERVTGQPRPEFFRLHAPKRVLSTQYGSRPSHEPVRRTPPANDPPPLLPPGRPRPRRRGPGVAAARPRARRRRGAKGWRPAGAAALRPEG
jgi:four helix bundle protein